MPRQKEFDPEEVLDRAMCLFWEKGYESTTIQDLVDRLGINKFSIYDTFGNKHDLFLCAIDLYRRKHSAKLRLVLEEPDKGLRAIKNYFRTMAADLSRPAGRFGCVIQNSTLEMALWDPEVESRIQETNLSFQSAIEDALRRAVNIGEIGPSDDLEQRARFLYSVGQGMIVVAKGHGDAKMLHDISEYACGLLDTW